MESSPSENKSSVKWRKVFSPFLYKTIIGCFLFPKKLSFGNAFEDFQKMKNNLTNWIKICIFARKNMMNKIVLCFLIALSLSSYAQERIYIDSYGNPVEKEKAELYRIITQKNDLFHIKDYYLDGTLQMEAFSKTTNITRIEDMEGKFTFYHKNGKIESFGEIKDGKKINEAKSFDENGQLIYHEKIDKEGKSEMKYITYQSELNPFNELLLVDKEGKSKRIIYDKDIHKIRYEVDYNFNDGSVSRFYDLKGKLIGTLTFDDSYLPKGTEVSYYHQPMRVKSIVKYNEKGEVTSQETYYPNGKIFSIEEKNIVYYDISGKKMGELLYEETENGMKNYQQGVFFMLNDKGFLSEKSEYRLGNQTSLTTYYDNGKEKSKIKYDLDGMPERIVFYTSDGKEKSTLNYVDGSPIDGTYYIDLQKNESHTTYQEGNIVSQVNYDEKDIIRYKKTLNDKEKLIYFCEIFDEKGGKQYEYTLDSQKRTMEITQFQNGKTIHQAKIQDGVITQGSLTFHRTIAEKSYVFHLENQNGWVVSQMKFNGELVREIRMQQKFAQENTFLVEELVSEYLLSEYSDVNIFY